jgi:hypothetical protein
VSKTFKKAIDARLQQFTRIDVRCYNGLAQMGEESANGSGGGGQTTGRGHCRGEYNQISIPFCATSSDSFEWHPHATLMVLEMGPHELGIAVDTKMRQEDVKALVQLLCTFRRSVEQLCMDSPIIELLVSQVQQHRLFCHFGYFPSSSFCPDKSPTNEHPFGHAEKFKDSHFDAKQKPSKQWKWRPKE